MAFTSVVTVKAGFRHWHCTKLKYFITREMQIRYIYIRYIRYIYIFAHDWHLPICQCTETCPGVSFIKNDKSQCGTFTCFLVVYFGLVVLKLLVKAHRYSSPTHILYAVLFPAQGQFMMVFRNEYPLELALYMTTDFLCMCLCEWECACGSFTTFIYKRGESARFLYCIFQYRF